jgi:hypothetical protein
MKLTVEISDVSEIEKLLLYLKSEKINSFRIGSESVPHVEKGDKSLSPKEFFGLWKNRPKKLEDIRVNAWRSN